MINSALLPLSHLSSSGIDSNSPYLPLAHAPPPPPPPPAPCPLASNCLPPPLRNGLLRDQLVSSTCSSCGLCSALAWEGAGGWVGGGSGIHDAPPPMGVLLLMGLHPARGLCLVWTPHPPGAEAALPPTPAHLGLLLGWRPLQRGAMPAPLAGAKCRQRGG